MAAARFLVCFLGKSSLGSTEVSPLSAIATTSTILPPTIIQSIALRDDMIWNGWVRFLLLFAAGISV